MNFNEIIESIGKPYFRDEQSDIVIYCADCRDILKHIPDKSIDLVLTDPPYGVNLGDVDSGQERERGQQGYESFSDTPDYLKGVVIPAFQLALMKTKRGIITPGNRNAMLYPIPDDIGVWYNPAGTGRGKWGFILAHLIFYYGVDPYAGRCSTASSAWALNDSVASIKNKTHPCPKPLKFTKWQVSKGSKEYESILDPFMGSGTTVVASKHLNRKCIGIEIEEKYCSIAKQRLSQSVMKL